MAQERLQRVTGEIKKELGRIIQGELKDPRVGFVTVTRVELSRDLRHATVYFSLLGSEKELRDTSVGLSRSSGFIRSLLARRIRMRYIPELIFRVDKGSKYSIHISQILEKIRKEDELKKKRREGA